VQMRPRRVAGVAGQPGQLASVELVAYGATELGEVCQERNHAEAVIYAHVVAEASRVPIRADHPAKHGRENTGARVERVVDAEVKVWVAKGRRLTLIAGRAERLRYLDWPLERAA
jgi:hypothetical protein